MWTTSEAPRSNAQRLPSTNEVEKKDKWVKRNMHFPENTNDEKRTKKETKWNMSEEEGKNVSLSDEARVGAEDNKYV